jgi:hypothetical protein
MTLRKTLQWTLYLLLALGAGGAGTAYWAWSRSDVLLRAKIEAVLAETVPDWDVTFADARFHADGRVDLRDVTIALRGQPEPLLRVPEVSAALDRRMLAEHQRIVLQRVRVSHPTISLTRGANGRWNWEDFTFPQPKSDVCPEVEVVGGTVIVRAEGTDALPAAEFQCRDVNVRLIPAGRKRFNLHAVSSVERAGALRVHGLIDFNTGALELEGAAPRIDTGDGLLDTVAALSLNFRRQVDALSRQGRQGLQGGTGVAPSSPHGPPVALASVRNAPVPAVAVPSVETRPVAAPQALPGLGIHATVGVQLHVRRAATNAPVDYAVQVDILGGEVTNPALPVPLHNLTGKLRITPNQVVLEDLAAANGESQLFVSGRIGRGGDMGKDLTIRATDLSLDRQVRGYIPAASSFQRMYDQISPAGRFNLDVHVATDGVSGWSWNLREFTALDCSLVHELFQLPVTGIRGTIRQEGDVFHVDLDGHAADRPVKLTGYLKHPGPELEAHLTLHRVQDAPLDHRFADALRLEKQQPVRSAIRSLNLSGLADVEAEFTRPAGAGQKFSMKLDALVHHAVLNFERFPYRIANLRGLVRYDPRTEDAWHFDELRGEHGAAVLSGRATFDLRRPPGSLDLLLTAVNVPIDEELRFASVTANPELDQLWREFAPAGTLDAQGATVAWSPGGAPAIAISDLELFGGQLTPAVLPYRWDDVTGAFAWRDNRLSIRRLTGIHGLTELYIETSPMQAEAYVEHHPRANVAWHVHLDDVKLRRVVADPELRDALPAAIRDVVAALDPQGPFDMDLGLDMKGASPSAELVTAHWGLRARFQGNRLFAGLQLDDVYGNVEIVDGVWDGNAVTADGYVQLASVKALDMPFKGVHGPFTVDGNRVTVGTPDWAEWMEAPPQHSRRNPYAGRQLIVDDIYAAEGHEGRLGADAVALLVPGNPAQTRYRVDLNLRSASLREWANQNGLKGTRLKGAVNGKASLVGHGTSEKDIRGSGWVQINPAQLYELPLIARIFSEIQFKLPDNQPPDNTAFHYAFGDFTLHDGLFDFSRIELIGDVVSLVGWGRAAYAEDLAGRVDLHFLTKMKNQIPLVSSIINSVPFVGQTVDVLLQGWMHVVVTGTVSRPEARIEPRIPGVSDLSEAIVGTMRNVNAGQAPRNARPTMGPQWPRLPFPQFQQPRPQTAPERR